MSRLVIVDPDTVARWNRERFRRHWAKLSQRHCLGRPRIEREIRDLIRLMAQDGWGAPRIHGELVKLGIDVSQSTVSRYMRVPQQYGAVGRSQPRLMRSC